MSEPKTHPQVHPIDKQLLLRIPLTLALISVALLLLAGMVQATHHTLDQKHITIQSPEFLVNINTDSPGELMLLPGIGKTIAARIIEHRQQYGSYTKVDQLTAISGISHRTVARLKPFLLPLSGDEKQ